MSSRDWEKKEALKIETRGLVEGTEVRAERSRWKYRHKNYTRALVLGT